MVEYPTVSVIILNWNGRPFLPDCLAALQAQDYPHFGITLIDNASTDDSITFVRQQHPAVKIIANRRNLGFAAGNNVALRQLTTDFAVLLNPDVVVSPVWLRQLINPMLADPTIGVAGCKLYYPDGTLLNHAGGRITHPQAMPRHIGGKETDEGQYNTLCDVDYVIGAAMAVRREILPQSGLFDEGYFLYFEDADFCFAARHAGYRVVVIPQAVATHIESAVAIKGSFNYLRRFHTGRWRFLLKHFPVEEITSQTFAAERHWLAVVSYSERIAAALAYETALSTLPSIWQARPATANDDAPPAAHQDIEVGLTELQTLAWQPHLPLATHHSSLISRLPLLGPLLARRQLARQQNTLLLQQLAAYETLLQQQTHLLRELLVTDPNNPQ